PTSSRTASSSLPRPSSRAHTPKPSSARRWRRCRTGGGADGEAAAEPRGGPARLCRAGGEAKRSPSMTPNLALRGRLIAGSAALLVAAGMIHANAWALTALGFVVAAALMSAYIWFYPTAIYLRRHKVELAWWVPPGDQPGGALTAGVPFALHVALRNRGQRPLRVMQAKIFASSAVQVPEHLSVRVDAGWEVELQAQLRVAACGHWTLHGALILIGDVLGLFEVRAYFPSPIGLKVFPKMTAPRAEQIVLRPQVGALH